MMSRDTLASTIVLLCRLVVGGVFIYASLDKLQHPGDFAQVIHNYRMVPYFFLNGLAYLLPVTEILVGVALVLGVLRRGAALLSGLMLVIFMVGITTALIRGLDISCGCFNTDGGHGVGLSLLFRDALLLVICFPPLLYKQSGPGLARLFHRSN